MSELVVLSVSASTSSSRRQGETSTTRRCLSTSLIPIGQYASPSIGRLAIWPPPPHSVCSILRSTTDLPFPVVYRCLSLDWQYTNVFQFTNRIAIHIHCADYCSVDGWRVGRLQRIYFHNDLHASHFVARRSHQRPGAVVAYRLLHRQRYCRASVYALIAISENIAEKLLTYPVTSAMQGVQISSNQCYICVENYFTGKGRNYT